ncbi:MAG TPA: zinc ribbon domain-containing protein [Candidatus Alistipes merdigallinarum]|nr:zinc ribbon domain-containing protein [Candidatus Alistipes merdigallinarum]
MEENRICPNCGTPLTSHETICRNCGVEIGQSSKATQSRKESIQSSSDSPRNIRTIEDMTNYLEELAQQANESTEAALQAQLQVIRYIQSPKLYDSSFDLLFKNLKKALKYADSPRMQEMIQERTTVMIQNYVFFMNAKLQFEVKVNREEYRKLVEDACKMLAESLAEVAAMAIPGGATTKLTKKAMIAKISIQVLTSKDTKGDNLFTRFYRWYTRSSREREKQGEFIQTMNSLTEKLYKNREIIGKSDLIAGLIDRYTSDMTEYFCGNAVTFARQQYVSNWDHTISNVKKYMWIILSLNVLVLLIRWIFKGVSYVSAQISGTEYTADTTHWAITQWGIALVLFAVVTLVLFIDYWQRKKGCTAALKEAIEKYNKRYQTYHDIARTFDE